MENGVLNYSHGKQEDKADATVKLSKATLDAIQLKEATIEQKIVSGDVKITGKKEAFEEFLSLLDTFPLVQYRDTIMFLINNSK